MAAIVSKWDHSDAQNFRVGVWDLLRPQPAVFLNLKSGSEPMATDFEIIAGNKVKALSATPQKLAIPK